MANASNGVKARSRCTEESQQMLKKRSPSGETSTRTRWLGSTRCAGRTTAPSSGWSELMFSTPNNCSLKCDPFLRNLRGDSRWAALLKKMNLPLD